MSPPVPYTDRASYDELMSLSMPDKLFFVPMVKTDNYVDFGCGTGEMLYHIGKNYPKAKLWGFDNDPDVLKIARSRKIPLSHFYIDFENLMEEMLSKQEMGETFTLIFSSVLHEVLSYKSATERFRIWDMIRRSGADYIVIRDMAITRAMYPEYTEESDRNKIYAKADKVQLKQFTNSWGELTRVPAFVHFLLKYPYRKNWARELNENYLGLFIEDVDSEFATSRYEVMMRLHYTLPYVRQRVKKDFDIDLKYPTHIKLIYRKKKK